MAQIMPPVAYKEKLTRAGHYLVDKLEARRVPIILPYHFNILVHEMYKGTAEEPLYLRRETTEYERYNRLRENLRESGIICPDRDYRRAHKITIAGDLPADEVACIADPICCISYLSAMQRWGLTNRSPKPLFITRPARSNAKNALALIMHSDGMSETEIPLTNTTHPARVRGRSLSVHERKTEIDYIAIRGTHARATTVPQTFYDTLHNPEFCGGMNHVIDVWKENARNHVDKIIERMNRDGSAIALCRAGYILEEIMGVMHPTVDAWAMHAQRGGSRKLDPQKPFVPEFSEKWMISINVQ